MNILVPALAKRIAIISGLILWSLSLAAAFGVEDVPTAALLALSGAECAIGIAVLLRAEMNLFYAAMGLRGIANLVLATLAWRGGSLPQGHLRSILFGALAVSFFLSLSPRVRSITAIIVRLRRFPAWFSGTKTYRTLDLVYSISWSIVCLAAAALSLTPARGAAINLVAITGLSCELVCFLIIRAGGYDYLAFVTGKAGKAGP